MAPHPPIQMHMVPLCQSGMHKGLTYNTGSVDIVYVDILVADVGLREVRKDK